MAGGVRRRLRVDAARAALVHLRPRHDARRDRRPGPVDQLHRESPRRERASVGSPRVRSLLPPGYRDSLPLSHRRLAQSDALTRAAPRRSRTAAERQPSRAATAPGSIAHSTIAQPVRRIRVHPAAPPRRGTDAGTQSARAACARPPPPDRRRGGRVALARSRRSIARRDGRRGAERAAPRRPTTLRTARDGRRRPSPRARREGSRPDRERPDHVALDHRVERARRRCGRRAHGRTSLEPARPRLPLASASIPSDRSMPGHACPSAAADQRQRARAGAGVEDLGRAARAAARRALPPMRAASTGSVIAVDAAASYIDASASHHRRIVSWRSAHRSSAASTQKSAAASRRRNSGTNASSSPSDGEHRHHRLPGGVAVLGDQRQHPRRAPPATALGGQALRRSERAVGRPFAQSTISINAWSALGLRIGQVLGHERPRLVEIAASDQEPPRDRAPRLGCRDPGESASRKPARRPPCRRPRARPRPPRPRPPPRSAGSSRRTG